MGIDDRDMMPVAAQANPPRDWESLWALHPAKKELFSRRMLAAPPFAPAHRRASGGVCTAQYKLAVVTSSAGRRSNRCWRPAAARNTSTPWCAAEAGRLKPAPDPYLLAARLVGASSRWWWRIPPYGIASGRAAGFEVLAVRRPEEAAGLGWRLLDERNEAMPADKRTGSLGVIRAGVRSLTVAARNR